jgi:hypothetical protein
MTIRAYILAIVFSIGAPLATSACEGRPIGQPTLSVHTSSVMLNYSGAVAITNVPVTVTLPALMSKNCNLGLLVEAGYLEPSNLPNTQYPQHALTYGVGSPFESDGSTAIYRMYATQGQVYEFDIPIRIPANQINKPAGEYRRSLSIRLINMLIGNSFYDGTLLVTATINTSCTLPPPSLSVLDFSGAVVNGTIPAPFERSLSFSNAGCNGPAKLTLAGQALAHTNGSAQIHYTASAILGASATKLDTQSAAFAFANAINAPASNLIPVSITVLPTTTPLLAGTYSSILRVSLEPSQ